MKYHLFVLTAVLTFLGATSCSSISLLASTPTATISPDLGRVTGTLQVRSGETVQPVKDVLLYLGETIKDNRGMESLVAFDRVHSPRTTTDAQGRFVFSDIKPGRYGLFLDTVVRSFLLLKPDSEEAILFEVSAGKETDVGTLIYESLPVTPRPTIGYPYPK